MASEYFVTLDEMRGENIDPKHNNEPRSHHSRRKRKEPFIDSSSSSIYSRDSSSLFTPDSKPTQRLSYSPNKFHVELDRGECAIDLEELLCLETFDDCESKMQVDVEEHQSVTANDNGFFYEWEIRNEMYMDMLANEKKYFLKQNGTQLLHAYRTQMVDWMIKIQHTYTISSSTLFRAVAILDCVLKKTEVQLEHLQVLAITCMWLAWKYEEGNVSDSGNFNFSLRLCRRLDEGKHDKETFIDFETKILEILSFRLTRVTSFDIFEWYFENEQFSGQHLDHAKMWLELALESPIQFSFAPSIVAAASILLGMGVDKIYHEDFLNKFMLNVQLVSECSELLRLFHLNVLQSIDKGETYIGTPLRYYNLEE